ncbi:MAG: hypothetical protein IT285_16190 [Bdellovibrionales bacterium]|nr:hypothetical protein [Bdellovibrionales bacterium]
MSGTLLGKKLPNQYYKAADGKVVVVGAQAVFENHTDTFVSTTNGDVYEASHFVQTFFASAREAEARAKKQREEKAKKAQ